MSPVESQEAIFSASEGDRWFERNYAWLTKDFKPEDDLPLRVLGLYGLAPASVLEIGAANGHRVAAIAARHGSRAVAVEPSARAIADGRHRHPGIEFVQGTAADAVVEGVFDLVIVNFVLHWIDRALLLRSVARIDSCVAEGGHLLLGDFLPDRPCRNPYHHLPEGRVYTYKQDYSQVFLASGAYRLVSLLTGAHGGTLLTPDVPDHDRIAVHLLHKRSGSNDPDPQRQGTGS